MSHLPWLLLVLLSCSSALGSSPCSTAIPSGTCSAAFCSGNSVRAGAVSLQPVSAEEGGVCGCPSPLQQDPQAKAFGELRGGCSRAGTNFRRVQGSARGCQALICAWLCFSSSSCCSLSGNAKESESQAAAENASLYLFHLFWGFFIFCKGNTSPAELAAAAKAEPAGASGCSPGIAKQRFPTYAKHRTGCQEGEAMCKEFVCCRHDKTEHQNQPCPTPWWGRQLESESCSAAGKSLTWLQLSELFLLTSSMQSMCTSQKMGLKIKFRLGKASFSLSHSQVTRCVSLQTCHDPS